MMSVLQVLDETGWRLCSLLGTTDLIREKYYLAGGTALALQLGHRKSYDLDFFQLGTKDKINFNEIYRELSRLFSQENLRVELKKLDQAVIAASGTKLTFLAYPFPLVEPLVDGREVAESLAGIRLASPREIALMKAYTIGRRASYRDYIDLYFLLKTGAVTIKYIPEKAPKKFVISGEPLFSPKLFLERLAYTEDISDKESALDTLIGEKITSNEVDSYLARKACEALRAQLLKRRGPQP